MWLWHKIIGLHNFGIECTALSPDIWLLYRNMGLRCKIIGLRNILRLERTTRPAMHTRLQPPHAACTLHVHFCTLFMRTCVLVHIAVFRNVLIILAIQSLRAVSKSVEYTVGTYIIMSQLFLYATYIALSMNDDWSMRPKKS